MNERIKEIANKAVNFAADQYGPQRDNEKVWSPDIYDQKFAEMIIDECCFMLLMMDAKAQGQHNYYKHAAIELKRFLEYNHELE